MDGNVFATKVEEDNDGTENIYVTKIIHAGAPENFVFLQVIHSNVAEYLLSSGTRKINYNTLNRWSKSKSKKLGYV